MPRVARFKIAAIDDLLRQLEYAPSETRQRQMDSAERLIADLDPQQNYPQEFIVYRITGYRSDRVQEPVTFVGEALVPDLVNMVQVLSEGLELPPHRGAKNAASNAITMEQLASRLRVSHKTLQRYRRFGLVCHYIVFADGQKRLGCYEDALQRFAAHHTSQLERAAAFSRVSIVAETDVIEQARRLRETESISLNEAALRIAKHIGRAHETIRLMLQRHDRKAAQPIFQEQGPITEREIALAHRAWLRGVEPAAISTRLGKAKSTVNRAVNRRRRELLKSLKLEWIDFPTFALPDAAQVLLSSPAIQRREPLPPIVNLAEWMSLATKHAQGNQDAEHAMLAAYNLLKSQAAGAIAHIGEPPSAETLDAIETDLRWASMLHRSLVAAAMPLAVSRLQHYVGRPLRELPTDEITSAVLRAVQVVAASTASVDPSRGHRLDKAVTLAMDKALAQLPSARSTSTRAAARHDDQAVIVADPLDALNPWDAWLNLRRDLRRHVAALPTEMKRLVEFRYGLTGDPPLRMDAVAAKMNMSPIKAVRMVQRAIRELRAMARADSASR